MKNISKKIKLTESDKRTILKNSEVCTDLHGKGCNIVNQNESSKNLN